MREPLYSADDGHALLVQQLAKVGVSQETYHHPAEGQTEIASRLRGHPLPWAAKSLVLMACLSGKRREYLNVVVAGDQRVDFAAVGRFIGGRVMMAPADRVLRLTGCVSGTVIPFSFHPELRLIADPALLHQPRVVFNAGRLDLSFGISAADYLAAARPEVVPIAAR